MREGGRERERKREGERGREREGEGERDLDQLYPAWAKNPKLRYVSLSGIESMIFWFRDDAHTN